MEELKVLADVLFLGVAYSALPYSDPRRRQTAPSAAPYNA